MANNRERELGVLETHVELAAQALKEIAQDIRTAAWFSASVIPPDDASDMPTEADTKH